MQEKLDCLPFGLQGKQATQIVCAAGQVNYLFHPKRINPLTLDSFVRAHRMCAGEGIFDGGDQEDQGGKCDQSGPKIAEPPTWPQSVGFPANTRAHTHTHTPKKLLIWTAFLPR